MTGATGSMQNQAPVLGRNSKRCRRMLASGRVDLFWLAAQMFNVLADGLNLEGSRVQLDQVADEMPFYLRLNTRRRAQVQSAVDQLENTVSELSPSGAWRKIQPGGMQRAIARCIPFYRKNG